MRFFEGIIIVAFVIFPAASGLYAVVGGGYYDTMEIRGKIRVEEDIKSYDEGQETRYRLLVSDPQTGYSIEEFLIEDSYPRRIWNSGSLLNTATNQQAKVCTITGKGKRIPFMSWYPNVSDIAECK
jgi:hypothetical protein